MFGLIRRISHSVIPRPDRPWADDPTSNAPQRGRKRRLSSTEREQDPDIEESQKKKIRGESTVSAASEAGDATLSQQAESSAVKEVTRGVKEVELDDSTDASKVEDGKEVAVAPEAVPLPEEDAGELDEPEAAKATPPMEAQSDDNDDNASSVNEDSSVTAVNGAEEDAKAVVVEEHVDIPAAPELKTKNITPTEPTKDTAPTTAD
ncbi:hypothetical protein DXG03_007982 [Asterophora parasitica]|uniref:Uncharacterized protein n=1 Tax=Asterophora parasitica TaxID=117018 RepID=A0A9P7GCU6_9AGAR|nr:hypothetical protein DXG03_007982 [Asterophora parasitica]